MAAVAAAGALDEDGAQIKKKLKTFYFSLEEIVLKKQIYIYKENTKKETVLGPRCDPRSDPRSDPISRNGS